jgi:hypothetical protein
MLEQFPGNEHFTALDHGRAGRIALFLDNIDQHFRGGAAYRIGQAENKKTQTAHADPQKMFFHKTPPVFSLFKQAFADAGRADAGRISW